MPQIFTPRGSNLFRIVLGGCLLLPVIAVALAMAVVRSPWRTGVGMSAAQPVPFSHRHHVSGIGIDCRYCHQSVERSAVAGVPATETCMSCHSQLWTEAQLLEPVRTSHATGEPLRWRRLHDLPDFVYFDHSIHVSSGVGCESCHGRVDRMALTRPAKQLSMGFCLECHRNPRHRLRPPPAVFAFGWQGTDPAVDLMEHYGIRPGNLTDCSVCHR